MRRKLVGSERLGGFVRIDYVVREGVDCVEKNIFLLVQQKKIVNCVLMIVSEAIANACRFYKP